MTERGLASRRSFLRLSVMGFAAAATGCTTSDPTATAGSPTTSGADGTPVASLPSAPDAPTSLTAADFTDLATCVLLPELTTGPFPLEQQYVRRDVTEGVPGHPVRLGFRVVDDLCEPVPGAAVEVWHTDATGDYSAFADGGGGKDEAEGTTFCRGTQIADEAGIVEFSTIWPGWYPGRCVHYHLRVHVDGTSVLASQVVFRDEETAEVFTREPYAEFGQPDTLVTQDFISQDAERQGTYLTTSPDGDGTLALCNLGIDPAFAG